MVLIENYAGEYGIYKITWSQDVANEFVGDGMQVILVRGDSIVLIPGNKMYPLKEEQREYLERLGECACLELASNGTVRNTFSIEGDNTLYITDKCNSNCIMCPMAEYVRKNGKNIDTKLLRKIVDYMPEGMGHLTITGGEPFFIRDGIFEVLMDLKIKRRAGSYLFLTNGRILSNREYVRSFEKTVPDNTLVGIPIHGSNSLIHDAISQTENSFKQTLAGIYNVLTMPNVKLEIRIVVNKLNIHDLVNIAKLISERMQSVYCVRFMGMEMLGNAVINVDTVWIPYEEVFGYLRPAIDLLVKSGIDVSIYNYPLCFVDRAYWGLCENSISGYKIRYSEKCCGCTERKACGGMFWGTDKFIKNSVRPIV